MQVTSLQVMALVMAVALQDENGDLPIDVSKADPVEELVQQLPETSKLRQCAPAIISLLEAGSTVDARLLNTLMRESWMTARMYSMCLGHVFTRAGLRLTLEALKEALKHYKDDLDTVSSCLGYVEV
jgi:hypothetical protein